MEVTALCIRLLVNLLMLLVAHVQQSYPQKTASDVAFHIIPTRLQVFEYQSFSFTCEGGNGLKVRNIKKIISKCSISSVMSTTNCTIEFVYKSDSGEYWCEGGGGERSNTVNITVTDAAVRIAPTRLQIFEYQSISFTCLGVNVSAGWRVRNIKESRNIPKCSIDSVMLSVTCTIEYAVISDSGEYWCEGGGGEISNTVNITVTDGSVILESPVLPVVERDAVTLSCRKKTSSNLPADFYKDGHLIGSSSTGEMTIHNVSYSDEGLYKCNISGAGESPESWLAVRVPDAAVRIAPTGLQIFEYQSISFTCEGVSVSAGWRVRNANEFLKTCSNVPVTSTLTCTIEFALRSDSGEYWCEGGGGERSNTVHITVTDGSVILESPVLPVVERDAVTLSCRNKQTSSNLPADFYKDGHLIGNSSTGEMVIHRVSKSDEGLYKCNISGAGESPESWLAVRDGSVILEIPVLPVMEGDAVTLKCRNKQTSSNLPADFYKEGLLIRSSSTGEMIIYRVSKSDEGLYKCNISGAGESPESWLAVRDLHRVTCFSLDHSFCLLLLVRTVFTMLIVAVLLPVVVLLHCGKLRVTHT